MKTKAAELEARINALQNEVEWLRQIVRAACAKEKMPTIQTITKLSPTPAGDIIVVQLAASVAGEIVGRLRDDIERFIPGVKCMVLTGGMELSALTRQEIEALAQ